MKTGNELLTLVAVACMLAPSHGMAQTAKRLSATKANEYALVSLTPADSAYGHVCQNRKPQ